MQHWLKNPFFDLQLETTCLGCIFSAFWPIEQRYLLLKFDKILCQLDSSLINPMTQTTEDILISFD
jgi:hypothetical protein